MQKNPERVTVGSPVEPLRNDWPTEDIGMDLGSLPADEVHDEADHAQWMQLRELATLQGRARVMNLPESHPDFDGKHCIDCDGEIPAKRLELHRIRCVDCQSMLEAQRARNARG